METLLSKKLRGLGKTQNEIANELNVSQAYIANVIKGKILKTEAIKKFTDHYNWNFLEIFNDFETLSDIEIVQAPKKEINFQKATKTKETTLDRLNELKAFVIPVSLRQDLLSNYFADSIIEKLEEKVGCILSNENSSGTFFNIEVDEDDMCNENGGGLNSGDWAFCKSIPKQEWRKNLQIYKWKIWCFFHYEHGIIFRHIESYDTDTGVMELSCYNPDKKKYPNFSIKIGECSYVCKVVKKVTSL